MEPVEAEVNRLTRISKDPRGNKLRQKIIDCGGLGDDWTEVVRIPTTVLLIEEYNRVVRIEKDGTEIKTCEGWFVKLRGSQERLFVGWFKPDLNIGDEVMIAIQKKSHG